MGPLLAIVGRPNVGKSSLFNVLVGENLALIADFPGLTRDRHYGNSEIGSSHYLLVDTGGITESDSKFDKLILEETNKAISESDGFIFLTDATSPLHHLDLKINEMLRKSGKKYILAINKSETKKSRENISEFYSLGVKHSSEISAQNGLGIKKFKESILELFPSSVQDVNKKVNSLKIGILGKPNAGKSTFFNALLRDERSIVSNIPGTTRDAISETLKFKGTDIQLTDTAGLRRKSKISDDVEKFSIQKAIQSLRNSDGIIYLIDGKESISDQDLHLISLSISSGKPIMIGINKSDLLDVYDKSNLRRNLNRKLAFAKHLDIKYISAKKASGTSSMVLSLIKLIKKSNIEFDSKLLSEIFLRAYEENPPPLSGRFRPKIKYVNLGASSPPTFIVHGNKLDAISKQYQKYLENFVRRSLNLQGVPMKLILKKTENPFKHKKNVLTDRQIAKRKRIRNR
ncbi:MAG: ribosome biogenesis GTPase Der [Flavobacteriaceae bacterium]|jgi:GTP-binding protein|nr:ribosome biogenesis GTPase Der [Flavobacteriaceae bacterium]|tara:strand:+ start:19512 stop:20888 length:1377 start_codon:yes stop_codon:yes gene_type:complete